MATKQPKKRPTDINQLAHFLGRQTTGEDSPSETEISRVMAALGRRGGKVGGRARADRLSPERRKEIASEAAKKRWASKQTE